jgi:hypothetical protein
LLGLKYSIPEIVSVTPLLKNENEDNERYSHGFIMEFNNRGDLKKYINHPEHKKVGKSIKEICDDVLGFDYER